jgi:hypothetical protein
MNFSLLNTTKDGMYQDGYFRCLVRVETVIRKRVVAKVAVLHAVMIGVICLIVRFVLRTTVRTAYFRTKYYLEEF